jgi:hypothetical protein
MTLIFGVQVNTRDRSVGINAYGGRGRRRGIAVRFVKDGYLAVHRSYKGVLRSPGIDEIPDHYTFAIDAGRNHSIGRPRHIEFHNLPIGSANETS